MPLFKEQGFTQEQAQAVVNATAKREADIIKRANDAYANQRRDWQDEVKKEFGNRLDSDVRPTIGRALDTLDATTRDAFRNAMDTTGAGDNPAFVKVFYQFAKQIAEGKAVTGAPPTPAPQRQGLSKTLYPNLP